MSREHAWWRFMTQFDTFDEDRIQYDGQMLRQFYLRNGYVDFNVKNINGKFTQTGNIIRLYLLLTKVINMTLVNCQLIILLMMFQRMF